MRVRVRRQEAHGRLPGRSREIAGVTGNGLRGVEAPTRGGLGVQSRRFEERGKQPSLGRKASDAEPHLPFVECHVSQQHILGRHGIARRLDPVQEFIVQPRRLREPRVGQV